MRLLSYPLRQFTDIVYSRDGYGSEIFTLRSTYFQGRPPKSVNLHWRRFAMSSIPLDDTKQFDDWLKQRWIEKDDLLEHYVQTRRFPADGGHDSTVANGPTAKPSKGAGYIETEVQLKNPLEFLQIFVPLAAVAMVVNFVIKFIRFLGAIVTGGER